MADGSSQNEEASTATRRLFPEQNPDETTMATVENQFNLTVLQLKSKHVAAREMWNFDFENEKPLKGDWVWEKVGNQENATEPNNVETKESQCTENQTNNQM